MNIPFFLYPHVFSQHKSDIEAAMLKVASSGGYIMQEDLREFESKLAAYVGCVDAIGVGNATDGLEMLVADAGIGRGDEVILPSHTFVASASAVVANGATPIFAEIDGDHLLDAVDVERRLTDNTRAIMPTQLNGRVADMPAILALAEAKGLLVLEDSAQGIGARLDGQMAGTFGSGGVLSFYPAKVLGCLGDGGAILATSEESARRFRLQRDHGRDPNTGEVKCWGRNSRLDNLQAAVLTVKLSRLDEEIEIRRALAGRYDENLRDVDELILPPSPNADDRHFDTFQNYEIRCLRRDGLRASLSSRGVGTILQWGGKGVHQFDALSFDADLPVTERVMSEALLLPMNTSLGFDDVDYVSESVRDYLASPDR
jgi:dTDP-4-amino-4,6-dideoxygalactose transaminase